MFYMNVFFQKCINQITLKIVVSDLFNINNFGFIFCSNYWYLESKLFS